MATEHEDTEEDGPYARALSVHCGRSGYPQPKYNYVFNGYINSYGATVLFGAFKAAADTAQSSKQMARERAAYMALSELGVLKAIMEKKKKKGIYNDDFVRVIC